MLIIGLGNPGAQYVWTRHNLGFMVVDELARASKAVVKREECRALIGRAMIDNKTVELVKPQTFMNLSGESVACLLRKRTSLQPADDLLVISDDLALPFGTLRLRARGSAGGHNGLKSIISVVGTDEFIRLRIGIAPEHEIGDTARFVLESFPTAARPAVEQIVERSTDAIRSVVQHGIEKAMSQYNRNQTED